MQPGEIKLRGATDVRAPRIEARTVLIAGDRAERGEEARTAVGARAPPTPMMMSRHP